MKVFKAIKHVFFGEKDEGCLEARGGYTTAAGVFLAGPRPAQRHPKDYQEGWMIKIIDKEVADAVAGTLIGTVPKGCQILATAMIIKTAGVAGGTTTTLSIGTDADPDKYCTIGAPTQADSLAKNAKGNQLHDLDSTVLSSDEAVQLFSAATGGTAAGDTAAGSLTRCVVIYAEFQTLKDYDA